MGRIVGRVFNIISTVLVILLALVLLTVLGLRIVGLDGYKMNTGDMEPGFPAGSLLLIEHTDTTELREQDSGRLFLTKADALEQPDPNPVKPEDVIGVPVFTVPYLGAVLTYMQTQRGMYLSIGIGLAMVLLIILPPMLLDRDGRRR